MATYFLFSFGVFSLVWRLPQVCNSLQESRAVGVFSADTALRVLAGVPVQSCRAQQEGEMQMCGSEVSARRRDTIFQLHRFLEGHLPDSDGRGLASN